MDAAPRQTPILYRTKRLAEALRQLATDHTHVVLLKTRNKKAVHLQRDQVGDVPTFHWKPWEDEAPGRLARWKERGGVLINYATSSLRDAIETSAWMFEAPPLSILQMERWTRYVSEVVVFGDPPNFRPHLEVAGLLWPSPQQTAIINAWLQREAQREMEPRRAALAERFGTGSCVVSTGREASEATGVPVEICSRTLNRLGKRIYCMIPRIATSDPGIGELFDFIEATPPIHRAERAFTRYELSRFSSKWKRILRAANAQGWIERKPEIYVVPVVKIDPPHLGIVGKRHRSGQAEVQAVEEWVRSLPEFPAARSSASRASTSDEGHAAGTAC